MSYFRSEDGPDSDDETSAANLADIKREGYVPVAHRRFGYVTLLKAMTVEGSGTVGSRVEGVDFEDRGTGQLVSPDTAVQKDDVVVSYPSYVSAEPENPQNYSEMGEECVNIVSLVPISSIELPSSPDIAFIEDFNKEVRRVQQDLSYLFHHFANFKGSAADEATVDRLRSALAPLDFLDSKPLSELRTLSMADITFEDGKSRYHTVISDKLSELLEKHQQNTSDLSGHRELKRIYDSVKTANSEERSTSAWMKSYSNKIEAFDSYNGNSGEARPEMTSERGVVDTEAEVDDVLSGEKSSDDSSGERQQKRTKLRN